MSPRPLLCTVAIAMAIAGCKKDEASTEPLATATMADAAALKPPDHLAPGELLEGNEKAFGLVLPRGFHVEQAFVDTAVASGDAKPEAVANYLRARVRMGTVEIGAAATMFERVQVPEKPGREIAIRVAADEHGKGCRIDFRDVTPPVLPPTEAERWRAAGLTPQGKLVDPTHLE